jgi:neutral ceramidase
MSFRKHPRLAGVRSLVFICLCSPPLVWAETADRLRVATPLPVEFRAGVARKVITPTGTIWMSGYAARTRPSEDILHDLWAKALALEDAQGGRVVIVTADLIGLPREVSDEVAARVKQKHGLERRQLVLNSSHTHSGPAVWPNLKVLFDVTLSDRQRLIDYRNRLVDDLVEVVGAALADLSPATLGIGHGSAAFTSNRRQPADKGPQFGVNPAGPVDRDVPVLSIASPSGKLRAVVFGYACHNTTLGGNCYRINGDYAGFAQIDLEKALPGATAMFLMLCGADQDPYPRGTLELAAQHGKALAGEVQRVLANAIRPVHPSIRTCYEEVKLDFAHRDRAAFEQEAKSGDQFRKRRAEIILAALDAGRHVWQVAVPVQVVGLGEKQVVVALGGEVVVDYSLRLKREYPQTDLIVAGYTNDVMCYIPSRRVLKEGGYEAVESMIYYGQPGPFAENVEETLIGACHRLLATVAATR